MDYKTICDKIIEGIRFQTMGTKGVVIGISGGIDSAVAAALSVLALGAEKVHGITMPYYNQDTRDADELADVLGIPYENINIGPVISAFEQTSPRYFAVHSEKDSKMPKSNLQSRVRMCLLYGAANKMNKLVIGTTNKSEYLLGYFTKHGDGAVDFEPIGDLYKTEVCGLAKYLKENHFPNFPQDIITKKPSADLAHGMADEEELGFSYAEFDQFIQHGPEGIAWDKLNKMQTWMKISKHKRELPKITKVKK